MIKSKSLILLFPMMTTLVSLLVGLEVFNSKIVLAKPIKSPIIKGQCGRKQKCETLFKQLTKLYPEYIEGCLAYAVDSRCAQCEYSNSILI